FTERPAMMVVAFPIEYSDLPDSLSLSGPTPPAVKAEIRGTGKQFIRLWLTEPRLKISLAGVRAGRFQRAISQDDLPLLASDRIVVERLVGPDSLDLHVERVATRRLPVAARVRGVPKTGWAWSGAALRAIDPERSGGCMSGVGSRARDGRLGWVGRDSSRPR